MYMRCVCLRMCMCACLRVHVYTVCKGASVGMWICVPGKPVYMSCHVDSTYVCISMNVHACAHMSARERTYMPLSAYFIRTIFLFSPCNTHTHVHVHIHTSILITRTTSRFAHQRVVLQRLTMRTITCTYIHHTHKHTVTFLHIQWPCAQKRCVATVGHRLAWLTVWRGSRRLQRSCNRQKRHSRYVCVCVCVCVCA